MVVPACLSFSGASPQPPASRTVRNPEGRIRLYCKGADTILLDRLCPSTPELLNTTTDHLNVGVSTGGPGFRHTRRCGRGDCVTLPPQEYAGEGLRTLVLAYKDLDEDYYEEWADRRLQASLAQDSREDRLASVYEEIESDMMVWAAAGGRGG